MKLKAHKFKGEFFCYLFFSIYLLNFFDYANLEIVAKLKGVLHANMFV